MGKLEIPFFMSLVVLLAGLHNLLCSAQGKCNCEQFLAWNTVNLTSKLDINFQRVKRFLIVYFERGLKKNPKHQNKSIVILQLPLKCDHLNFFYIMANSKQLFLKMQSLRADHVYST